ncbi:unnamed protein product [Sympodiomycopsis kandeliae]
MNAICCLFFSLSDLLCLPNPSTCSSSPLFTTHSVMASNKANSAQNYYELYRRSSIGVQLTSSLDTLIQSGHINPLLAIRVLNQFDRSLADTVNSKVKAKATVKGHLRDYNSCDEVWTFNVKGGTMKLDSGENLDVDRIRIVACKLGEAAASGK